MTNTEQNVVWITGASSGIGKAMAFEWARLGYKVALSSRRKELLDTVADEIKKSGGEVVVIPCDIMEETSIQNAVQQIISTWGRLEVSTLVSWVDKADYFKKPETRFIKRIKNVDFKKNITLWGLNEFIVLTKE